MLLGKNNQYSIQNEEVNNNIPFLYSSNVNQEWYVNWGDPIHLDFADGLAIDSMDDIYITGFTEGYGALGSDIFLLKYDTTGSQLWNTTWGGSGDDEGWAIGSGSSDDIYIGGSTSSFGALNDDIILLKYNSTGSLKWDTTWGGPGDEKCWRLVVDSSDNIYLTGETNSFGAVNGDIILLKYNKTGALQWNYTWGSAGNDRAEAIGLDSLGNIYIAGESNNFGTGGDICLLKYNNTGALQWNYTWGGIERDFANSLAIDSSSNIYLVGTTKSYGALGYDVCLLKYDTSGALLWNYTWGGAGIDNGLDLVLDSSDNIFVAGSTRSYGALGHDILLLRYDPTGTLQWNYTLGGVDSDYGYRLAFDSSDNIFITGFEMDSGFDYDVFLAKLSNKTPLITFNQPNQNEYFNNTAPAFDISIYPSISSLDSSWYTLDNGATNITLNNLTGSINQTEWDKKVDGLITIRFYANDSSSKVGLGILNVYKDTVAPTSSISYNPFEANKVYKTTNFTINADDGTGSGVSVIRYRVNDSNWVDYDASFTLAPYSYGYINISYQTIDEAGNVEAINTELVLLVESPQTPEISGYKLFYLLSFLSVALIVIKIKKKTKPDTR